VSLYRKKSEPVEARQWTGYNAAEWKRWLDYACISINSEEILIDTGREAFVVCRLGDWVVKDEGFYPVEPVKFHAEYEAAE
jgi:hypothetical protein